MSARMWGHSTSRERRTPAPGPMAPIHQKRSGVRSQSRDRTWRRTSARNSGEPLAGASDPAAPPAPLRTARGRTSSSRRTGRPARRRCRSSAGRSGRGEASGRVETGSRTAGRGCSAGSPGRRSIANHRPRSRITRNRLTARPWRRYHLRTMGERTSAGILLYRRGSPGSPARGPPRAPGRTVLRQARPRRLDDPEGRARRPPRASRRVARREFAEETGTDRRRRRRSSSARSSRRAARSSMPGPWRATSIPPMRTRTSSRWSGRRGPGGGAVPRDRPRRVVRAGRGSAPDQADPGALDRSVGGGPRRLSRAGGRGRARDRRPSHEPSWPGPP